MCMCDHTTHYTHLRLLDIRIYQTYQTTQPGWIEHTMRPPLPVLLWSAVEGGYAFFVLACELPNHAPARPAAVGRAGVRARVGLLLPLLLVSSWSVSLRQPLSTGPPALKSSTELKQSKAARPGLYRSLVRLRVD